MISEICGKEHETVGMSSVLGDRTDGAKRTRCYIQTLSRRSYLPRTFNQHPGVCSYSRGAPTRTVMERAVGGFHPPHSPPLTSLMSFPSFASIRGNAEMGLGLVS